MPCKFHKAIFHAILAAALYALSIPLSKLLLTQVQPTMLAAHLYIGAGVGMAILGLYKKKRHEKPLQRSDLKYTSAMVALDIAAPILLLLGLKHSPAASAYYAIAPFIGVFLSMLILGESPNWLFFIALAIMLIGTYLASAKAEE